MTERNNQRILYALFGLSRATLPIDLATLADAASLDRVQAMQAISELDDGGLVDGPRLRLTMVGLMRAAALGGDLGGTAPVAGTPKAAARGAERLPMAARGAERAASAQNASPFCDGDGQMAAVGG